MSGLCASVYLMACSIIMLLITKLLISGEVLFLVQETVQCISWGQYTCEQRRFFCIIFCSTVKSLPADAFLRSFICFLFYVWLSTVCTINFNSFCMVKCWVNNCIIRDCCGKGKTSKSQNCLSRMLCCCKEKQLSD